MSATDLNTLKANIESTISSAAASISGNQVRDILLSMIDTILVNSNYGYTYDTTLTLSAGRFTLLAGDLSTISDSLATASYIAFNVKDASNKDLTLYQSNESFVITLNLPDGSNTTYQCDFEDVSSDVITFSISSRVVTGSVTVSDTDSLNISIDSLDANSVISFDEGLTKTGNTVKLGDSTISENIELIASGDGLTFYLSFPDAIFFETSGAGLTITNTGLEIDGLVDVVQDLILSDSNWVINSEINSVTPKYYVDKNIMASGTTLERPVSPIDNEVFKDSTLGYPIYWDETAGSWKDFTGTNVA